MTRFPSTAVGNQWSRLWVDTAFLMADTAAVMTMRTMRIMAGGPAAARETERMLAEKVEAGFELAGALAAGTIRTPEAVARKTLSVAGKRIRANRKRLA